MNRAHVSWTRHASDARWTAVGEWQWARQHCRARLLVVGWRKGRGVMGNLTGGYMGRLYGEVRLTAKRSKWWQ
jgi:hypothetical protein